ncbi:MAG: aminoacyl-tRNA hydrolase [Candidatus Saccharimonas sp.]
MKLIIGIGNPELRFAGTRHNTGFTLLDSYAAANGAAFKHSVKFKADIAELTHDGEKVLLVKPTTYYNLVGESVRALCDFYKLSTDDILVIHDELALPFGTIRTRLGGSDAGNNGVKSLNQHIGTTTQRLRIGVWNELCDKMNDADFVLAKFSATERMQLTKITDAASSHIDDFIAGKLVHHTLRVEV